MIGLMVSNKKTGGQNKNVIQSNKGNILGMALKWNLQVQMC